VKKHSIGQICVAKETKGMFVVSFYEVTRSTTNTCEIRELRKEIISQISDEQEVTPIPGEYISLPMRKKVTPTGAIQIKDDLYAWPWTGTNYWQPAIIFLP